MVKKANKIRKSIYESIETLRKKIKIEQVFLFGSYADNRANKFSDIDLAVISNDFRGKRLVDVLQLLAIETMYCNPNIEILGYTVDDLKEATKTDFLWQIKHYGKLVYKNEKYLI